MTISNFKRYRGLHDGGFERFLINNLSLNLVVSTHSATNKMLESLTVVEKPTFDLLVR